MSKLKSVSRDAGVSPGALTQSAQSKPLTPGNGQRFTTPQIAHRFQVTSRTIQNWRDEGKIPFIRVNSRCIRYDPDAVEKALSNGQ